MADCIDFDNIDEILISRAALQSPLFVSFWTRLRSWRSKLIARRTRIGQQQSPGTSIRLIDSARASRQFRPASYLVSAGATSEWIRKWSSPWIVQSRQS